MRVGHVIEVVRVVFGESRDDAQLLDTREHEHGEQHVEELDGQEQRSERRTRHRALHRERHAVVADEHESVLPVKWSLCSDPLKSERQQSQRRRREAVEELDSMGTRISADRPLRMTRSVAVVPTFESAISRRNCEASSIALPLTETMTSPGRRPASYDEELRYICDTNAPWPAPPAESSSNVMFSTRKSTEPRRTSPYFIKSSTTRRTSWLGTAKPMP